MKIIQYLELDLISLVRNMIVKPNHISLVILGKINMVIGMVYPISLSNFTTTISNGGGALCTSFFFNNNNWRPI